MKMIKFLPLLVFICAINCDGARILFLGPVGTRSHHIGYFPIAEALATKGHHVIVVSPFTSGKNLKNVKEIVVENIFGNAEIDWFNAPKFDPVTRIHYELSFYYQFWVLGYDAIMKNDEFHQILTNRSVDLVIIDFVCNELVLPIVDSLKVPFIYYSSTSPMSALMSVMSLSWEYATIPSEFVHGDNEMSFFTRFINTMSSSLFIVARRWWLYELDQYTRKDFPNARPAVEVEVDASLSFVNQHWTTAWPRPLPPNVIPITSLHIRPLQPLPDDLQTFADESTEGFVIFTLGSLIPISSIPQHIFQAFLRVFSQIPQRVICKWEKSDFKPDVPPNVLLREWLPQQDLLGHRNARLFISHGGLLGLQETIHHGVPLLGLPFHEEQSNNLNLAKKLGFALRLDWDQINEGNLGETIAALLGDSKYRSKALEASRLVHDELLPSREVAVYWVEHVLRHNGAKHLEPASRHAPFYKTNLLDIAFFLAVLIYALLRLFFRFLRFLFLCLQKPSEKVKVN